MFYILIKCQGYINQYFRIHLIQLKAADYIGQIINIQSPVCVFNVIKFATTKMTANNHQR